MSFILDALKKSENERQRTIGPSLADAPVRRHQTDRPWWALAVAALLIVNLGVLLIVLTRDKDKAAPAEAAAAPAATPAAAPTPAPAVRAPASAAPRPTVKTAPATNNPAVRSLAEEAEGGYSDGDPSSGADADAPSHPGLSAAASVPSGPSIVRPIEAPAVAPLAAGSATFPARSANEASAESVPTLNALVATGATLPDLHLDIHVYSTKPTERFVFVNMRKYHEGEIMSEGPTIERITPEGAVLSQHGQRFLLPRP